LGDVAKYLVCVPVTHHILEMVQDTVTIIS